MLTMIKQQQKNLFENIVESERELILQLMKRGQKKTFNGRI